MGIKDYFYNAKISPLNSSSINDASADAESYRYVDAKLSDMQRFIPHINLEKPENFARYGLAEMYYEDSIKRIYKTYPYDGSLYEKVSWENSSSYIDKHVFDNLYPRTTGYIIFTPQDAGWGTSTKSSHTFAPLNAQYGLPSIVEYITASGGPHAESGVNFKTTGSKANVWDQANNRESNLKIGGEDGNTVEFWLKKSQFLSALAHAPGSSAGLNLTDREVIVDVWTTGTMSSSADYGRLTVEMTGTATDGASPFLVTYMSGTKGFASQSIGTSLTTSSIADDAWHHYAFTFQNSGSSIEASLYIDGKHNQTIHTGSTIDYVSGNLKAAIGCLITSPSGSGFPGHSAGGSTTDLFKYGKLSGSLDEFRYWKKARSARDIGIFWNDQVGGGTNTDLANTQLGVYYKFNEGIIGTSSVDSVVLDYAGRVSNGAWTGYSSDSRNTGSAIIESSASAAEFKDPIIYSSHADVANLMDSKKRLGREWDSRNPAAIYHSLPGWILEDDEKNERDALKKLVQIISSYFDTLHMQAMYLPRIGDISYGSSSFKPLPFVRQMIESRGFIAPDIFADADVLEKFLARSTDKKFEDELHDIKNLIYQNIYNNLSHIYKTKGTEQSIRNLVRCFGVDDELIRINMYTDGATYTLKDNYRSTSVKKKYASFQLSGNHDATVFMRSSSVDTPSMSYLSGGNSRVAPDGYTFEAEVLFPHQATAGGTIEQSQFTNLSSSLFGAHSAQADPNDFQWNKTRNAFNFQVYAIRDSEGSKNTYFKLTGTTGGIFPNLTTSVYRNVYDNEKWNFAVRVIPGSGSMYSATSGSLVDVTVDVEFYGVNMELDYPQNEFHVSGTIPIQNVFASFFSNPKRFYIGAHKTGFTGSTLASSDVKISSFRGWASQLDNSAIKAHAADAENHGVYSPYKTPSGLALSQYLKAKHIPQIETLLWDWDFQTLTGSDASGQFVVQDRSSGSYTGNTDNVATTRYNPNYGILGLHLLNRQYTGLGYDFDANNTGSIANEYVYTAKKRQPEIATSTDMVTVISQSSDDQVFTRDTEPLNYYFAVEKSMYSVISDEMIKIFSTIMDFNNLIGEPVNRYRPGYKDLAKLRQMFFDRVQNTPDLDRYIDFYKWLDSSLTKMIAELIPASANFSETMQTVIESHVLERNKYHTKVPTMERKKETIDPEATLMSPAQTPGNIGFGKSQFGLANNPSSIQNAGYSWKQGHAPVTSDESENGLWWKERAIRSDSPLSSSHANPIHEITNEHREKIRQVVVGTTKGKKINLRASDNTAFTASAYFSKRVAKPYNYSVQKSLELRGGSNQFVNKSVAAYKPIIRFGSDESLTIDVETIKRNDLLDALDAKENERKERKGFHASSSALSEDFSHGDLVTPFSIYSASAAPDITSSANYKFIITNFHDDSYGSAGNVGVPMQGLFTEKYVGGSQHRHVEINTGSDSSLNRPEAWILDNVGSIDPTISAQISLKSPSANNVHYPRAQYYRDEIAKRPVNIRNIKQSTGSRGLTTIGNYEKNWQVVQTAGGRSTQNKQFVLSGGFSASHSQSFAVSGTIDFELPTRQRHESVIVSRFSAPGGPEINSRGFLDTAAEEYSLYNALPWRNATIRAPLDELLTKHCGQFGVDSEHTGQITSSEGILILHRSASYHKINKNPLKRINPHKFNDGHSPGSGQGHAPYSETSSLKDNWFIQHAIPRQEMSYRWITASAQSGPYGFSTPDDSNAGGASTDITFESSSHVGSYIASGERVFGSDRTNNKGDFLATDFVGMNGNVVDAISASTNILGYVDESDGTPLYSRPDGDRFVYRANNHIDSYSNRSNPPPSPAGSDNLGRGYVPVLNAVLLNRNGPYQHPSWKQIRGWQHPIARFHRKNNMISYVKEFNDLVGGNAGFKGTTRKEIRHFTEPVVTSKYMPFVHKLDVKPLNYDQDEVPMSDTITMVHTYGNNISKFTYNVVNDASQGSQNRAIHTELGVQYPEKDHNEQVYNDLKGIYILDKFGPASSDTNPIEKMHYMDYKETVFPKGSNTFLGKVRGRESYADTEDSLLKDRVDQLKTFWKDNPIDRSRHGSTAAAAGGINSFGYVYHKQQNTGEYTANVGNNAISASEIGYTTGSAALSVWPLDCNNYWPEVGFANYIVTPSASIIATVTGGFDGLDGTHPTLNGELGHWSAPMIVKSAYPRGQPATASMQYEYGNYIHALGASLGLSATGSTEILTHCVPKWTTNLLAGKNPWYDSYEDYSIDIRAMAKDYSIIPEFRISEHMDHYVLNGFSAKNNKFLTLEGASGSLSASAESESGDINGSFYRTYAHTDFMKYFGMIKEDHEKNGKGKPMRLTLRCKGIKKLLPYNGFYPVLRTMQLGSLFSQSFGPGVSGSAKSQGAYGAWSGGRPDESLTRTIFAERFQALIQPLFAPGVLFNTIKSGLAVDYPVYSGSMTPAVKPNKDVDEGARVETRMSGGYEGGTESLKVDGTPVGAGLNSKADAGRFGVGINMYNLKQPSWRMPFEAIIEPQRYLPVTASVAAYDSSGRGTDARETPAAIYLNTPALSGNMYAASTPTGSAGRTNNYYAVWDGKYDNRYTLAAHNFFAETARFFLKGGAFTNIASNPAHKFKPMLSGTKYIMDVVLRKTIDMVMYEGPRYPHLAFNRTGSATGVATIGQKPNNLRADPHLFNTFTMKPNEQLGARGMHYGPALVDQWDNYQNLCDPKFAAYTPPYFYGTSVARIQFDTNNKGLNEGESRVFSLDEIMSECKAKLITFNQNEDSVIWHDASMVSTGMNTNSTHSGSSPFINQMAITASVNMFGRQKLPKITYDATGKPITVADDESGEFDRWVISPKFECPVLNFSGNLSGDGSDNQTKAKGMWKGYGEFPTGSDGIFLEIRDPDSTELYGRGDGSSGGNTSAPIGSLVDVCGFKATGNQRIGEIADNKTISEAIVAIPFIDTPKGRQFFKIGKNKKQGRFWIDLCLGNGHVPDNLEAQGITAEAVVGGSIIDMVEKMQKYVVPPQFDFLLNKKLAPFAMYIMEFEHTLSRQDLADIWQGVMPQIAMSAEKAESVLSHPLATNEFFGGKDIPNETRWMVFKIKQKAEMNYYAVTADTEDDTRFSFEIKSGKATSNGKGTIPDYSYNWPYDYFSLVEVAKMQSEVRFEPAKPTPVEGVEEITTSPADATTTPGATTTPTPGGVTGGGFGPFGGL